jgi:hypothetical protein
MPSEEVAALRFAARCRRLEIGPRRRLACIHLAPQLTRKQACRALNCGRVLLVRCRRLAGSGTDKRIPAEARVYSGAPVSSRSVPVVIEQRAEQAPMARSRPTRLREAERRLDEQLWTECEANAGYEASGRVGG